MAKGKKGGKKKKEKVVNPDALTEVDKTFFELTIADLNRKLARLRSLTTELEQKNEELTVDNEKNDEDKNDIITYLKRILQEKTDEINELEERIKGLQETRQAETEKFEEKITEMDQELKTVHEQLTSENKLLEGKLNSLEEFRSQRDELMKKFEEQEKQMEMQDKKHMRELYEIERKFIISKDKLKKDMEARLLQLSAEFHDASELRIAATTQRVIRENITVNNELDNMLRLHQRLFKDYSELKNKGVTLRQEAELSATEKKKALAKSRVQTKLLEKLCSKNSVLKGDLKKHKQFEQDARNAKRELRDQSKKNDMLEFKVRILEQNLYKVNCENASLEAELRFFKSENDRLDDILMEGVSCIKESLTITDSQTSLRSTKRESLLNTLFTLLSKAHERRGLRMSVSTIPPVDAAYEVGDLGFVPKPITDPRPIAPTRRTIACQIGDSFENFLKFGYIEEIYVKGSFELSSSDLQSDTEQELEHLQTDVYDEVQEKVASVLFFDEEEVPEEETEDESADYDPFEQQQKLVEDSKAGPQSSHSIHVFESSEKISGEKKKVASEKDIKSRPSDPSYAKEVASSTAALEKKPSTEKQENQGE